MRCNRFCDQTRKKRSPTRGAHWALSRPASRADHARNARRTARAGFHVLAPPAAAHSYCSVAPGGGGGEIDRCWVAVDRVSEPFVKMSKLGGGLREDRCKESGSSGSKRWSGARGGSSAGRGWSSAAADLGSGGEEARGDSIQQIWRTGRGGGCGGALQRWRPAGLTSGVVEAEAVEADGARQRTSKFC
uniref:Uncharacterized protein n=1 Tax=Oryza sativa subsp. japonica TaxID=39947 RepID=Q69WY5_ORYSJ|nr:hypothetical protein [Oryza sativa Japonica Group]BAD35552.1 hypothetical protein [Oryza sativa Japonica Group]